MTDSDFVYRPGDRVLITRLGVVCEVEHVNSKGSLYLKWPSGICWWQDADRVQLVQRGPSYGAPLICDRCGTSMSVHSPLAHCPEPAEGSAHKPGKWRAGYSARERRWIVFNTEAALPALSYHYAEVDAQRVARLVNAEESTGNSEKAVAIRDAYKRRA